MRNYKIFSIITVMVFSLVLTAGSLQAENKDDDNFSGSFMLGYRMVDTDGVETKYKEDINLDKGPRLFHFKMHYEPTGDMKKFFDRLDVRVYNFGGDPYESMGIDVVKYGKYKFKYDRRKSAYYYHDMLDAHDYHTFNFDRINDSGLLKIWLGKKAHVYMDFNRYTKKGESVTTFDFNRVEFEFEKPVDEESTEVTLGLSYSSKWFGVVLEEKIQNYENMNTLYLPGYADGGAYARYPSAMYSYNLGQPYDMDSYTHSARFTLNPMKNLLLRGRAQLSKQDTEISYYEDAWGLDYMGYEFMYANSGEGEFTREIQLYDLDISYILSDKLAIIGAARYNNFEQTGSMTVNGEYMPMELTYETGGVEAGIQYQASSKLGFTLGFRMEKRDVEDEIEIEEENAPTERTGFFGNIKLKLSKAFKLTADYQYGTYENPLTLISPTDFHRFRLTAKYHKKEFYINGSYLMTISESDQDGTMWESNKNQLNLRLGYHGKKMSGYAGYALIDITREGDRVIAYPPAWSGGSGSFMWDILFEGQSNLFDAYLHFKIDTAWGVGGYFNYYQNKGSWELTRNTFKAFLKYQSPCGIIGQLNYWMVDFKEEEAGLNDYKANIFEISFGYRW
jgi:hypothetical protein